MSRPIKCYFTQSFNAEHQEHVFAETRGKAITQSEAFGWDGEFTKVQAVRKPEYDKYSDQGYVPVEELLKEGWWFECCGYDEKSRWCCKALTAEDDPVVIDNQVYCKEHAPKEEKPSCPYCGATTIHYCHGGQGDE